MWGQHLVNDIWSRALPLTAQGELCTSLKEEREGRKEGCQTLSHLTNVIWSINQSAKCSAEVWSLPAVWRYRRSAEVDLEKSAMNSIKCLLAYKENALNVHMCCQNHYFQTGFNKHSHWLVRQIAPPLISHYWLLCEDVNSQLNCDRKYSSVSLFFWRSWLFFLSVISSCSLSGCLLRHVINDQSGVKNIHAAAECRRCNELYAAPPCSIHDFLRH